MGPAEYDQAVEPAEVIRQAIAGMGTRDHEFEPSFAQPISEWPDRIGGIGLDDQNSWHLGSLGQRDSVRLASPRAGWINETVTSNPELPLPLRRQAAIQDGWLEVRLSDLLPTLMDRAGIDLWLVLGREYNEDPILATLLPAEWLSARRRTVIALHRNASGVQGYCLTRYPIGPYRPAWPADQESQHAALRRLIDELAPLRIGINVSETFALADGLSHTEHRLLVTALGPHSHRLVPAEALAIGWLETRLPAEIEAAHALNRLAHEVIAEAFSTNVITTGRTTASDVAWWIRQRFHDLGVQPWFQPTVVVQRGGVALYDDQCRPTGGLPDDALIEAGDLLHCDVGLMSMGLHTDTQRNAYVLRAGESKPPAGLAAALIVGNRMQDITTGAFIPGRTGNTILRVAKADAAAAGIDGDIYSHPVGYHGHAAGPTIGMWDEQGAVPGAGEYPLHDNTIYALELCVRTAIPDWDGQLVRMALEQGIVVSGGRVSYLDERQTELILV